MGQVKNKVEKKKLILLVIAFALFSCSSKRSEQFDADELIRELDTLDVSTLQDVRIGIREATITGYLYMISNANRNDPVYFVEYNTLTRNVTSINREMLHKSNVQDYFSDDRIEKAARKFSTLSVCGFSVDNLNNLYARTCLGDNAPSLLRVNSFNGADTIRYGHLFKHYKGNWYIHK